MAQYNVNNAYNFDTYAEALQFARVMSEKLKARIPLLEKLDSMTPWHVLQWIDER